MNQRCLTLLVCYSSLAGLAVAQTVRDWTSNSDSRWNRNGNWSGNNQPDANNEIAQFGSGRQLNPKLNANNLTVRGLRFSAGADSFNVGDDTGFRTLRIGNASSGLIENLSANDQTISIGTLQFQSDATIRTAAAGMLTLSSNLTGTNRNLIFNTSGDITVTGNISTGTGALSKQGAGNLNLAGINTSTGLTAINAGTITVQNTSAFSINSIVSISAGAALRLNDLSSSIGHLSGSGAIDFGGAGTGRLTLDSGTSLFGGSILGRGELVIGAGATFTLGADFNNSNLDIILAGGTLNLGGHQLNLGSLTVTNDSIVDFASNSGSVLASNSIGFATTTLSLTVQNWTDATDYFYSQTAYAQGAAPLDQVIFQGWDAANTRWQSYDHQITPVPEPANYGTIMLLGVGMFVVLRRRRSPGLVRTISGKRGSQMLESMTCRIRGCVAPTFSGAGPTVQRGDGPMAAASTVCD